MKDKMGIPGFNKFIKSKVPEIYQTRYSSSFRGKRLGIDASNILFRFKSTANKQVLQVTNVASEETDEGEVQNKFKERLCEFVLGLLRVGISPVFVFDGKAPVSKLNVQKERQEKKLVLLEAIEKLKQDLKEETNAGKISDLRKKMCQVNYLTSSDIQIATELLSAMGIPCLKAKEEADKLLAMMCREGKVEAVYSTDTDLLAMGTPIVVTDMGHREWNPELRKREDTFKVTIFEGLLKGLGMSYATFLDLCIMAGCDYNENIKGIAFAKAFKLLIKSKSIEAINLPNKECLNTAICRKNFGYEKSSVLCETELILDIDKTLTNSRDILEMHGCSYVMEILVTIYKNFGPIEPSKFRPPQQIKLKLIN